MRTHCGGKVRLDNPITRYNIRCSETTQVEGISLDRVGRRVYPVRAGLVQPVEIDVNSVNSHKGCFH